MNALDPTRHDHEFARKRVGWTLKGKYHLDRLIGIGGMAAVYAATHRNGMKVAVKVLHPLVAANPQVRTRFLREGYLANTVDHPGAVRVLDDDELDDGGVFLVMELLEGETLEEKAERHGGTLPSGEVFGIAHQVLGVLVAAHRKGIIHRDIKPENVFLTNEGGVKVLDFGIARVREVSEDSTATRTGVSLGTPTFMAPEQARGKVREVDAQSDIWSVGAVIFAGVSGRYVHEGETAQEVMVIAATQPARSLRSIVPSISAEESLVVDRALAFLKEDRWPSAEAMREAIEGLSHKGYGVRIRNTLPDMGPYSGQDNLIVQVPSDPLGTQATVASDPPAIPSLNGVSSVTSPNMPALASPATVTARHRAQTRTSNLAGRGLAAAAILATLLLGSLGLRLATSRPVNASPAPTPVLTSNPSAEGSPTPTTPDAPGTAPPTTATTDVPSSGPSVPVADAAPTTTVPSAAKDPKPKTAPRPPRQSRPSKPAPTAAAQERPPAPAKVAPPRDPLAP